MTYGLMGWLYESLIWAPLEKKEFINRGFLIGPFCPIYGVVSILDWYALHFLTEPYSIFFSAMIVCCICEYFISWSLEQIFHIRWWDYSNYPFNLNGRISLYSAVVFGLAGLLLVKIVHPFMMIHYAMIPANIRNIAALVVAGLLILDLTLSAITFINLNNKLKKIYERITSKTKMPFEKLNDNKEKFSDLNVVKKGSKLLLKVENINEKLIGVEHRILKAFPNMKFKYTELVKEIREKIKH